MELFEHVYNETSTLVITLVAMDKGVDPPRGATATVRMTMSNTCLMNVLFEEIDISADVNTTTGVTFLRIPRYWVYEYGT